MRIIVDNKKKKKCSLFEIPRKSTEISCQGLSGRLFDFTGSGFALGPSSWEGWHELMASYTCLSICSHCAFSRNLALVRTMPWWLQQHDGLWSIYEIIHIWWWFVSEGSEVLQYELLSSVLVLLFPVRLYSQIKWSVHLKITLMNWLFDYWTHSSFQGCNWALNFAVHGHVHAKGLRLNVYSLSGAANVVIFLESGCNTVWWKAILRSSLEKTLA